MSGVKVSDYELQQAVALRISSISRLNAGEQQRLALQQLIEQAISGASTGLQDAFSEQVNRARSWAVQYSQTWSENWEQYSQIDLNAALQTQQQRLTDGQQAYRALNLALTEQASALGQELSSTIANLEALFYGSSKLIHWWRGEQRAQEWQSRLKNARGLLSSQNYRQLQSELSAMQAELEQEVQAVQSLEAKQQQRLLLLRSLREIFADMGFTEIGEPMYEQPGQRGSRILYRVDTHNRGEIVFHLSLNGIRSNADMGQDHCFEEFDKLSGELKERFGIITSFEPEIGERPPQLKRKGEKDLPSGKSQERQA